MPGCWGLPLLLVGLSTVRTQPTNIECTGVMALHSRSGSPHGPWSAPTLLYAPSSALAPKEWYSAAGVDNPTLLILQNGTSILAGRTCSGPEHPWLARSEQGWNASGGTGVGGFSSWPHDAQPWPANNSEDPFMWRNSRGHWHALWHWQGGRHNEYYNGGHSFSADGRSWVFSQTPAYSKNISWSCGRHCPDGRGPWTVVGRRERPGLLLDTNWTTPLVLFSAVADRPYGQSGASWLQSQPINQVPGERQRGGSCQSADPAGCSLNGVCEDGVCRCDPQWTGPDCGVLDLLPADPNGGYRRAGFNGWGGNPFYWGPDNRFHLFTVEMTNSCQIGDFQRNSQIVHATSATADGKYELSPIDPSGQWPPFGPEVHSGAVPAPASAVLHAPFAHAPHAWRDPTDGSLVVVFEGRQTIAPRQQKNCTKSK